MKFENAANTAARAIYIDMDDGIAAEGIEIDSGGTARTGSDIVFTDDSTGAHSVLDINSSGSGASIGLDFTGTYSGSPAGSAISITLGNGNNLDTNGILFTGGTGVRTAPVINIDDAGTGSASMIDIDLSGAYTGNIFDFATSGIATGNVFFVNLDTAVAMTALHIEGSGARTQPMVEIASDATGTVSLVDVTLTGAISGHVFEISMDTTSTGDVLNVDMNAAVGGRFLFLDAGAGARTANLVDVTYDATGNLDFCEITDSNTGTGHLFDVNVSGAGSGNVLDIVYGAALDTGDAININLGATATGAQAIVLTSGVMTRTTNLVEIAENGAASGNTIDVGIGAVTYTGNVLDINMGATATGGQAVVITSGAMTRTVSLIQLIENGTSSGATFDIDRTAATTGIVFDIDDTTGVSTGNIFDYATTQASTGVFFNLNFTNAVAMRLLETTLAGTRTQNAVTITHTAAGAVDVCQIDDSGTSSGHVFDINSSGNSTGNVVDITMSSGKVAGDAIAIEMATDLAGRALFINQLTGNIRTAPLVYIANAGTDGGTDDHVLFINQTGLLDSNLVQLTFATAASTGNAISISMDTNVAGMALDITSVGTGVSNEGSAINIAHTGALVAGADVIRVAQATGALSSTSNVLAVEAAGNSTAGSYAVYINASGTGIEALKVDAGIVVFDETLEVTGATTLTGAVTMAAAATVGTTLGVTGAATLSSTLAVTGATTLSSTLSYRNLTEVVTATNVLGAAESGSVFFLNSATEFVSTLPAPAAGLHFTFVITAAPSGANYTVVPEGATNIIYGSAEVNGASVPAVAEDSINFVSAAAAIGDWVSVWCDGTNWYVKGMGVAAGSITFTAV